MTNALNWLIVLSSAFVKLLVGGMCLASGQLLAGLYALSIFISTAFGLWNACVKRELDSSASGMLIPVLYFLSSIVITTHSEPGAVLSGLLAASIAVQIGTYFYLGKSFSMGVSTWVGLCERGPYRWIRHPGLCIQILQRLLFVIGFPCAWNVFAGGLLIVSCALIILLEERYLHRFVEYKRYCLSVPYRLVPRIW